MDVVLGCNSRLFTLESSHEGAQDEFDPVKLKGKEEYLHDSDSDCARRNKSGLAENVEFLLDLIVSDE